MRKEYLTAPLPFVGQKRMFAREYKRILSTLDDNAVFVDLFGGSGLLSHITKYNKPNATVVYNDYDNCRCRLENIERTNKLLADLREIVKCSPRHKLIDKSTRERIFQRLEREEQSGFVDYITISSSLLFSMKYVLSLDELRKEGMYNNVRKTDYSSNGYLDGLMIESCDYKELFNRYKDNPNVVFLVDPPYLCTEVGTYNMSWRLGDYLDVLTVLQGKRFVYFTSNKSSIVELCNWLGNNKNLGNPFEDANKVEFNAHMNYNSHYTDIMLYRIA